jgi:hypothetical protein
MSSPLRRVFAHVAIAAFALLLLAGCGRTIVDPPEEPVSLHILGDASYLFQARGETVRLSAELRFPDGSVSAADDVTWTSDDARVEVAADGTVTARDDVGSAKIRAAYGQLVSDPVEVYVVQAAANTRILTEGVVEVVAPVSDTAASATLARTAATDALAVGDIIVTNEGLFGRIEQLVRTASGVEVVVELVPLREAFDRIDIGMESEAVELAAVISADGIEVRNLSDPLAPVQRLAPSALKCETEAGVVNLEFDGGRATVKFEVRVFARYRYDSATGTEFFELYAQGVPSISAESLVLETTFGPNTKIDCTVSLAKLEMPVATFWGILTIAGKLEPKAGFRIEAAAQTGQIKIQGPYVNDARLEIEAGIRHSQAGWEGLGGGLNPIRARVAVDDYGWGSFSVEDGLSLSLAMGPILKFETGASFKVTIFDAASVDFLDPTIYLRTGLDIPNVDADALDYAGVMLSLALVGESSIKFEVGGGLGRALKLLGINAGFRLGKAGFELGAVFEAAPPELTASRSLVNDTSGVTFTARDAGRRQGRVITFQAFDADGIGTRIGTATTGADGVASFTWFPTAAFNGQQRVRGLLDVGLGFPIRSEETLVLTVDVRGSASDPPAISNLVPARLDLTVIEQAAELPTRSASGTVAFGNVGGGTLAYELRLDPPAPRWLVIDSRTTGTLGFGASTQAELTATCVDGVGTYEARLLVSSNDALRPELATDVTLSCSETLPLTVDIERPTAGDIVSSNVLVEGTLTHERPLTALTYRVGSRLPENAIAGLRDGRFSFSIPSDRFVSIEGEPTANTITVEAADDLGAVGSASVTVIFDPATAPAAGRDVVVFNDINLFDDGALSINANNVRLIENLIDFSDSGERELGTVVWFDRGRNSQCFVEGFCGDEQLSRMRKAIEDRGYSIVDANSTLGSITSVPANVKVVFLWNPRVAYTAAEINVLKTFSGEGGRIVFVGEHEGYYGASIPLQNQFLADMGALMRNAGEAVDCSYTLIPGASLRPHQITERLPNVTIACASVVELGPNDFPLFYDTTNTKVLAAVAAVDVTPIAVSSAAVWGLAPATEPPAPDPSVTSHGRPRP